MQRFHRTLATAIATTTLLAATAFSVNAQTASPTASTSPAPCAQFDGKGMMNFAQHHAQHLEQMKTILQLQPNQQAAWEKFAKSMEPMQGMMSARQHQNMSQLTTPERLDMAKQMRQERTAKAEQREAAVREFYASLTPSQQKAFDTVHNQHRGQKGMHNAGPGKHMKSVQGTYQGKGPGKMPANPSAPAM